MDNKEKIYIGRTETKEGQYGKMHKVSFGPMDFEKMQQLKNDKGWLNCLIKESKDGGLYLQVDTWEPKEKPPVVPSLRGDIDEQVRNQYIEDQEPPTQSPRFNPPF